MVGGPFLVLLVIVLSAAYVLHWALVTGAFGSPHGLWYAGLWLGVVLIATAGWLVLNGQARAKRGASSVGNQIDRAVWTGVLLAIGAVVVGSVGRGMASGDPHVLNGIMAAAFGLYGVALGAGVVISGRSWLQIYSFLAYGVSSLLWMYGDQAWAYLFAAASTLVVLVVPGLTMIRNQNTAAA